MLERLKQGPRRILMTVDAVGGVWQYALGLAEQMKAGGDRIVLAGLGPLPSPDQRRQAEELAPLVWLKTPPDWMASSAAELDGLSAELAPLIRDYAIDLVQLNAPSQAAGLSVSCPVVVVAHSCVVTWFHVVQESKPPAAWAWHVDCNRAGLERADAVIAPSNSHATTLTACYGALPRLEVVHNAVRSVPTGNRRRDMVAAAGRWWDSGKNGAVLDAAAGLAPWPIVCAGAATGPNGDGMSFRNAASLGSLSHAETLQLVSEAGIFVSPSLYEPFGLAALEAARAGTPLILSDIPTYRELWGDAALYFPPNDPAALAEAIGRLSASERLREDLGAAGLRRSRRYTLAKQAAAMRSAHDRASATHARAH